jgi:Spy/CpxP family protein refolding chaperone
MRSTTRAFCNGAEHQGACVACGALADNARQLEHARKAKKQREELFSIIRNNVFQGDKEQRAAEQRLRQRGTTAEQLQTFEQKAAQVSTPKQMSQVEHEIMP